MRKEDAIELVKFVVIALACPLALLVPQVSDIISEKEK